MYNKKMSNWPKELIDEGNEILKKINFDISTPNIENVLRFFNYDFNQIKIVIIGQDPYPTPNVANGIAFATNLGNKIPMSLKNIFKEIEEIQGFVKTDQTLEHWEKQGVLLLNRSLTTEHGKPNAHKKIWEQFTNNIVKHIDSNLKNIFWVLWGNEAIKLEHLIKNNTIIKDAHPSPLSVSRRKKNTFKILIEKTKIIW